MWWLRGMAIGIAGLSLVVWGCGDDSFGGTGQGTLQLVRFGPGAEEQPDAVGATGAQIDVCQNLCVSGEGGDVMLEEFSSTQVAAIVVNQGKSDIIVDSIQIGYPGSGLTDLNTAVAGGFAVPGGRCAGNSSIRCAAAFECVSGICTTSETAIPFTIFDLGRKSLVGGPACGLGVEPSIVPAFVAISGRDADGERYTISGGMNLELADFDNCEEN
jgi:hypothetical protein